MRTRFGDFTVDQDQNLIGIDHRRQPVRDRERGAAACNGIKLALDRALGGGI